MSLYARLAAVLAVALLVIGAAWKFDRMLDAADERGYNRRAQEDKDAAEAQAARNRELGRLVEMHHHVTAASRDKFLAQAAKEIHDAAAPLAACPVPEPVRVRLNAAAACARGDSPAACGPGDGVPGSR